jgi:hypothetical protein
MSDKKRSHNKGQSDAAKGKGYNPPHGMAEEFLFGWGEKSGQKIADDNKSYKAGYQNGKSQKK